MRVAGRDAIDPNFFDRGFESNDKRARELRCWRVLRTTCSDDCSSTAARLWCEHVDNDRCTRLKGLEGDSLKQSLQDQSQRDQLRLH